MRRVPAILLVLLFSYSLIGPALLVDDHANLPACCRRDGKHHCGMAEGAMANAPSTGPAVAAARVKCPLFPGVGVLVAHSGASLATRSRTLDISIDVRFSLVACADDGYGVARGSSHLQRGPPGFLSF